MSHHKIINAIADTHAANARARILHTQEWLEQHTESPIEALMGMRLFGLLRHGDGINMGFAVWDETTAYCLSATLNFNPTNLAIVPQYKVGAYRLDFAVFYGCDGVIKFLAVECDGHEFHERTKQQAQRDKSRDRFLQSRGIPVFRFTGSEIFANAPLLLEPVGEYLWSKVWCAEEGKNVVA